MNVDLMYNPLTVTCRENESLADVASRMRFNDVGSAVVLDGPKIAGIITERDLTRAVADGADSRNVNVWEYMTTDPTVVAPGADARDAARMMAHNGIRHLPVVEDGKLVGLISARDILIELLPAS